MNANRCTGRVAVLGIVAVAMLGAGSVRAQVVSMVSSPHDLSAGSVAAVHASIEDQVCVFCHTPHNASPIAPLWNRALSPQAYTIYTSRALDARPGQPTGSSKLCLSCHDGTIALGSVLSRNTPIQMSGGVSTMPRGPGNLGTDLRDDHPISFRFDATLAAKDGLLRDPAGLPSQIKLDANRELQCTSCHDAHNNAFGKFLVMRNTNSELCVSCHSVGRTDIVEHGQCADCHQSHTAPSGPYLLKRPTITKTCTSCHDGSHPKAIDVASDLSKVSAHDTGSPVDPDGAFQSNAACTSCHDPHTMMRGAGSARRVGTGPIAGSLGRLGRISGVNDSGAAVKVISAEQEVCYKCHAEGNAVVPIVPRRISNSNIRLQMNPSAISRHPVGTPGRAASVPSLRPGWTTSSTMRCSDCHGSDSGNAGVHGSSVPGLLVAAYETRDYTTESAATYALCYQCHDRGSLLDNRSFPGHRLHIVDKQTPCAACHAAHGVPSSQGRAANNSHLINFATTIVFPDRATGRLEYRDTGASTGECFLSCHGVDHSPKRYPVSR